MGEDLASKGKKKSGGKLEGRALEWNGACPVQEGRCEAWAGLSAAVLAALQRSQGSVSRSWHSPRALRGAPSGATRACRIPYSARRRGGVSGNTAWTLMGDGASVGRLGLIELIE